MTVTEFTDGSLALKAGMKVGDTLLKVDGTKVGDRMELTAALRGEAKKKITVLRDGKEVELTIDFGTPSPAQTKGATLNP